MISFEEIKKRIAHEDIISNRLFENIDGQFWETKEKYGHICKIGNKYYGAYVKKVDSISELDAYLCLKLNCKEIIEYVKK